MHASIPTQLSTSARSGAMLALTSMLCAQIGLAGSVRFLDHLGAQGSTWLRLTWTAVIIVVIVRPWRLRFSAATLRTGALLGLATAGMGTMFMAAAMRIPLGTASAIEFLGALSVAAWGARQRNGWIWPLAAAVGVLLMTRPWLGDFDLLGVGYALAGAGCYAAYILCTQRVGDETGGVSGLAISMPVAALVSTLFVPAAAVTALSWQTVAIGLLLATLVPLLPFTLEMLALRRLTAGAFATLLCFEPAFGLILGLLLLGQVPSLTSVAGLACVVIAGMGAVNGGSREDESDERTQSTDDRHLEPVPVHC